MKAIVLTLLFLSLFSCKSEVNLANAEGSKEVETKKTEKDNGEHKPPIEKSAVPDGHWYCDMGTVHYSRAEKGDGKCPLCGMKLHHKEEATK